MARFKDILKIRDNILITCNTIKIFGVAKKPRGLYCRTKLKTIEWQIHHISTYEVRFAVIFTTEQACCTLIYALHKVQVMKSEWTERATREYTFDDSQQ